MMSYCTILRCVFSSRWDFGREWPVVIIAIWVFVVWIIAIVARIVVIIAAQVLPALLLGSFLTSIISRPLLAVPTTCTSTGLFLLTGSAGFNSFRGGFCSAWGKFVNSKGCQKFFDPFRGLRLSSQSYHPPMEAVGFRCTDQSAGCDCLKEIQLPCSEALVVKDNASQIKFCDQRPEWSGLPLVQIWNSFWIAVATVNLMAMAKEEEEPF